MYFELKRSSFIFYLIYLKWVPICSTSSQTISLFVLIEFCESIIYKFKTIQFDYSDDTCELEFILKSENKVMNDVKFALVRFLVDLLDMTFLIRFYGSLKCCLRFCFYGSSDKVYWTWSVEKMVLKQRLRRILSNQAIYCQNTA